MTSRRLQTLMHAAIWFSLNWKSMANYSWPSVNMINVSLHSYFLTATLISNGHAIMAPWSHIRNQSGFRVIVRSLRMKKYTVFMVAMNSALTLEVHLPVETLSFSMVRIINRTPGVWRRWTQSEPIDLRARIKPHYFVELMKSGNIIDKSMTVSLSVPATRPTVYLCLTLLDQQLQQWFGPLLQIWRFGWHTLLPRSLQLQQRWLLWCGN